jgi:hypothetical protein
MMEMIDGDGIELHGVLLNRQLSSIGVHELSKALFR